MRNFGLFIFFLLLAAGSAAAQTDTTPNELMPPYTSELVDVGPPPNNERPVGTANLSARSQDRLTNLAANMSNRFDAVIARLQKIQTRLENRINKIEATGQDVSAAQGYLQTAQTSLSLAEENMRNIDVAVAGFVGGTNPRESWIELRDRYTNTRDLVRSAHADMRAAILALKNTNTQSTSNE